MNIPGNWRPDRTGVMVILVCAVGVAVATLAFAALSAVLLRPLPYAEPERIVRLAHGVRVLSREEALGRPALILDLARRAETLAYGHHAAAGAELARLVRLLPSALPRAFSMTERAQFVLGHREGERRLAA